MPTILTDDSDFRRSRARPSLLGLLDAVKSGQSQVWQIFSDSTGVQDSTTRWPFIVAQAMATALASTSRVVFHQLRGTSEPTIYSYFKPILLSAGAGPRGIQFLKTGSGRSRQIAADNIIARGAATNDLQVIVGFDPTDAAPAAAGAIAGQPGQAAVAASTPSTRGWYLTQETSGNIRLTFWGVGTGTAGSYADGTLYTAEWTAVQLGIVPGTPRIVKFTVDLDNGSGDWTALAYPMNLSDYVSAVGVTTPVAQSWGTGLAPTSRTGGGAAITAGANISTAVMEIGARGNSTAPFYGTVYHVSTYDGVDGPMTHSPNIDDFVLASTGANSQFVGSPALHIYNGAAAGKDFAWFAGTASPVDAVRPGRIMTPGADVTTISTGHNEAVRAGATIKASMDTWEAAVLARSPMTALHMILQNPELIIASDATDQKLTAALHGQRQREMANYARRKGYAVSDVFTGFKSDSRWDDTTTVLMSSANPAVHPSSPEGYTLEASIVAADFGLAIALV